MVSVGPGNHWGDVTEILEPIGLAVVGGCAINVGVRGLPLGGSVSYFSRSMDGLVIIYGGTKSRLHLAASSTYLHEGTMTCIAP